MIYLIRHGQTEQNNRKILTGRANYQLNETGLAQARGAGVWLRERNIHVDLVYASPLDRALDTAALAAPGVETRIDERLIEMEFGPYEGMDLLHPAPEVKAFFSTLFSTGLMPSKLCSYRTVCGSSTFIKMPESSISLHLSRRL